jgi:hypothetical protein
MASEATYTKMTEAMQRVTRELQLESDRGCVVLAFAWMDECLTQNLLRFLLPSAHQSAKADELLGVGRPIGDAATKIDLSFRLGLLQPNTHKSLHLFRELRNDFAHLASSITFETPTVRDRVLAIFDLEEIVLNGLWASIVQDAEVRRLTEVDRGKSGAHILRDTLGTKPMFATVAGALVGALVLIGDSLTPVNPPARPADLT